MRANAGYSIPRMDVLSRIVLPETPSKDQQVQELHALPVQSALGSLIPPQTLDISQTSPPEIVLLSKDTGNIE